MLIHDAHAHIGSEEEIKVRKTHQIKTFLCAANPQEAAIVEALCRDSAFLIPTYGLHPWYAEQFSVAEMLPFLKKGRLLGEIGMDSEWCDVPLTRQKEIFLEQLTLAQDFNMPVILHTKGQEKEILSLIRPFTPPILVHWYSDEKYLAGYIKKDCFFSIGPDVGQNAAVQNVVKNVRLNRLLVESDGMDAVRWASTGSRTDQVPPADAELPKILRSTIEFIADAKGMHPKDIAGQLIENFLYLENYRTNLCCSNGNSHS